MAAYDIQSNYWMEGGKTGTGFTNSELNCTLIQAFTLCWVMYATPANLAGKTITSASLKVNARTMDGSSPTTSYLNIYVIDPNTYPFFPKDIPTKGTKIGTTSIYTASTSSTTLTLPISGIDNRLNKLLEYTATWRLCLWPTSGGNYQLYGNTYRNVLGNYVSPTVNLNVGGTQKKGITWTNVGGTWRIGETWCNVGGTWKKGI